MPFFMRGDFLQDTKDVFRTWELSKTCPEENLEFKIIHTPQLEVEKFNNLINTTLIVLDETSLLILNELNLLENFLKVLPNFSILTSFFQEINIASNSSMSTYKYLSEPILNAIQNNIERLHLIDVSEESKFSYESALEGKKGILITDDLYLTTLISINNSDIYTGNIFNALEYLYSKKILTEDIFYEKISAYCALGVVDINVRSDLLGYSIDYYLGKPNVTSYKDTGFKLIFDKSMSINRDFESKYRIFLDMFICVNISKLNYMTLLSMINKLLEKNKIYDSRTVITIWLIYCGLQRKNQISLKTWVSNDHFILWLKYKDVMKVLSPNDCSSPFLLEKVIRVICGFSKNIRRIAFYNLKSSFRPQSIEYQSLKILDKLF